MVKLDVPRVAQTKDMSCWNASAQMLWYYSQGKTGRAGPMNSLGDKFAANTGVSLEDFMRLAKSVGLIPVPELESYSALILEGILRTFGPVWCAGQWYGVKHIIVLTGVESGKVFINDPDKGVAKEGTLEWFNQKLDKVTNRMMVKDPSRY